MVMVTARHNGLWRDRRDIDVLLSSVAAAEELLGMTIPSISSGTHKYITDLSAKPAIQKRLAGWLLKLIEREASMSSQTSHLN